VTPCFPADWKSFRIHYRYRETMYLIDVMQTDAADGEASVTVDGVAQSDTVITLIDDRREHAIEVRIQAARS